MKVDVTKILDDLKISYTPSTANNVAARCFNPYHEDNHPSMHIHTSTGAIYCFTCQYKSHILHHVQKEHKFNQYELIKYVQQFQIGGTTEEDISASIVAMLKDRKEGTKKVIEAATSVPDNVKITEHPYLMGRGFTTEELLFWNMGQCTKWPYQNWVYIPIYFNRILRNYFLRSNTDKTKLYGPFPRKDILFGFDTAKDFTKPVYICEGIFDMIYLRRMRVQALALLSNHIAQEQLDVLKNYVEINVVPDIDKNLRGMQAIYDIFGLVHKTNIFVLELPNGKKDPAECTLEELVHADFHKTTITQYVMRDRFKKFLKTVPKKKHQEGYVT